MFAIGTDRDGYLQYTIAMADLDLIRKIQALAQTGLHYARDPFDRERYEELTEIVSRLIESHGSDPAPKIASLLAAERGYATPKVDVRGLVFRNDRVLLVRERSDGCWTVPGGWADVNLSPAACVEKEVREESGFTVRATKLLAVHDRLKHDHPPEFFHSYKLFFRCEITGGEARPSVETSEVGFYGLEDLPSLSTPRITLEQLKRMFDHHRQPGLPTDFD